MYEGFDDWLNESMVKLEDCDDRMCCRCKRVAGELDESGSEGNCGPTEVGN